MVYIDQFFFGIFNQLRKLYLNSHFYDKKISKITSRSLIYKPSPHLLSSLIKYQKKKIRIEEFSFDEIWKNKNLKLKEFKNLNSFYWFFSLDLKSSKQITQSIISNWISHNHKYNSKSWNFDFTAKRIIAWLSCHNLTYDESKQDYRNSFNKSIQKQTNHLINEINRSKLVDDKLIACASIILVGLCYQNEKNYLSFGSSLLKRISKLTLDNYGFPKSRNIKQLIFYLKYFILIREWFKESQINIPEHLDETIYYLGQGYAFFWQNSGSDFLFNGNNTSNNFDFDNYLKRLNYKFKNENKDYGGYIILKNKKICLAMDVGSSPDSKYTKDYQSGSLSFEIISNGKKLISNCGYFNYEKNHKLNELSKSTASQSTLAIDDNSSCKFTKNNNSIIIKKGLKIIKKSLIFEKNYWKINASHDGYLKNYNSIHERDIEFYPEQMKFIGTDRIIKKKMNYNYKFDIRFHVEPVVKLMKTQDNKTILIELKDEGWKFTCENYEININNGLYFGNKNLYTENYNIFITGIANKTVENIKWEIKKI
ncbi:heparinase II/III-family protein [Pelagibacterales bacterium SAG-MED39]|nr:heparinase II/III-family protein [Pelagibacterales bacterium SAG-MED39]